MMQRTPRYVYVFGLVAGLAAFAAAWFIMQAVSLVGRRESLPAAVPVLLYAAAFLLGGLILALLQPRGSWIWGGIMVLPWVAALLLGILMHQADAEALASPGGWMRLSAALAGGCLGGFLGAWLARVRKGGRQRRSL